MKAILHILSKTSIALLLCATSFQSCEEMQSLEYEIDIDNTNVKEITFDVNSSSEADTKGRPISSVNDLSQISLYGFKEDGVSHFENSIATPNGDPNNSWSFSPAINWPTDSPSIDFIAYTPHIEETTNDNENGLSIISVSNEEIAIRYTVPQDYSNHPDLMVAPPTNGARNRTPSFSMQHPLSTIGFSVTNGKGKTISYIAISNIISDDTLTHNASSTSWGNSALSSENLAANLSTELLYAGVMQSAITSNDKQNVTTDDGYLMMIPQRLTSNATIYIGVEGNDTPITLNFNDNIEWLAGNIYNCVINLADDDEDATLTLGTLPTIPDNNDYRNLPPSNCYILNPPTSGIKIYKIPYVGRINTFWGYTSSAYAYDESRWITESNYNEAYAEILWHNITSQNGVRRLNIYTVRLNEPNYIIITVPAGFEESNVVVGIMKGGVLLWSWHFWITEYCPYGEYSQNDNDYIFDLNSSSGEVHRYSGDGWMIGGEYESRFMMDRPIGSSTAASTATESDMLYYQYGRKDPFTAYNSYSVSYASSSMVDAVCNPTTFYTSPTWGTTSATDNFAYDNVKNSAWCDPTTSSAKSIFDPSPYGWMIPPTEAFTDYDNASSDAGIELPLVEGGYISYSTGNISRYGLTGYFWSTSQPASGYGYGINTKNKGGLNITDRESSYGYTIVPITEI